jgi:hypothetical protein
MDDITASQTSVVRNPSPVGIDDFLIDYRHHQSSIQEFLSCLDRSDLAEEGMLTWRSSHQNSSSHPSSQSAASSEIETNPKPSSLESKTAIHGQHPKSRFGTHACTLVCNNAHRPKKTFKDKQDMTEAEKEERRRFQNREAQRRFRERQMREEYRRASLNQHGKLLAWLQTKTMSKY